MLEAQRTEGFADDTEWAVAVADWAQSITEQAQYPMTLWCFRDKILLELESEPRPPECWLYMRTLTPGSWDA